MLEILLLGYALAVIAKRAQQRGLGSTRYFAAAAGGWALLALGFPGMGWTGFFLRWLAVGIVYLVVERAHGGATVPAAWQCPDCRFFHESGIMVCLCGYRHPLAPVTFRTPHWQCPNCRFFHEPGTVSCLCGYRDPLAP